MKTLNLTGVKTARELVTDQFKEDIEKIIGENLKTYIPAFKKGLRDTKNLIPTLKMLIENFDLNLGWQFDEDTENITVEGHNFNCSFVLQSIGLIAERWGKEPKYKPVKVKPENCTRHLKFGLWFKAIKEGLVKVENGKALKLVGFEGENQIFCEFGEYFKVPNIPDFKLYTFNAFSLKGKNSGTMGLVNETEAFIQFYNQITRKALKPVNSARAFVLFESPDLNKWRK